MSRTVPRRSPPLLRRHRLRNLVRVAGLFGTLAVLVTACGGGGGGAEGNVNVPRTGGELRVTGAHDLNHLDPLYASTVEEHAVLPQMYDSLLHENRNLDLVPGLATSWRYTDPATLVLTLRQNVTFGDGSRLDAGVVKFNLERARGAAGSPRRDELSSISSVGVDGPDRVTLHLGHPDSALLSNLAGEAGMLVSPRAVESAPNETSFDRNPIGAGSGPFQYYEWRPGDHLIMLANGRYWGQRPYVHQLTYAPDPNLHSQFDDLRNGFQNVQRSIARDDIPSAQHDPAVSVSWQQGTEYTGIELNNVAGPFANVSDRQAVAGSIDRMAVVDRDLQGIDTPASGVIPPRSWAFDASLSAPGRTLGTASGLSFTLKTDTLEQDLDVAQTLQSQLRAAGITMRIQPEDSRTLQQELQMHRFDAALVATPGGVDPDQNLYKQFHSGGSLNYGQFSDPVVDSDLDRARLTTDQSQRKALYDDAQRRLVSTAGFVPLTFPPAFDVHNWTVRGYAMYPNGVWQLNGTWMP